MYVLFTDFDLNDPYIGQVKAVLYQQSPGVAVVDLFSRLPAYEVSCAAYLLAAYYNAMPKNSVYLCVVDPGVGSDRDILAVYADERWFIGPDNGIFEILLNNREDAKIYKITWRPKILSNSFHGRDIMAPVAVKLQRGLLSMVVEVARSQTVSFSWANDNSRIIYIDHFGNAITGLRASSVSEDKILNIGAHNLQYTRVFSQVKSGYCFWYKNSNGLIEIACNCHSAAQALGLSINDQVNVL